MPMKADVYTGFLTDNVKVFGTKKEDKPFVLSGRKLRKAGKVLLASLMMSTLSARAHEHQPDMSDVSPQVLTEVYQDVLQRYNLTSLSDKEPLPEEMIKGLMTDTTSLPVLQDTNYNHSPADNENFWEIVKHGLAVTRAVQRSSQLSDSQKTEYRITAFKMLSQITRLKGTENQIDLGDYNNLKAFLYFEKAIKYQDNYQKVLGKRAGLINEQSEFFGRYYQDADSFAKICVQNKGIKRFAQALYGCDERFVLTYNDSIQANAMSYKILENWLQKQNIKDENLWRLTDVDNEDYCNVLAMWQRRGTDLRVELGIDAKGDLGDATYSPVGLIIIHELQHLAQKKTASQETPEDNNKVTAKARQMVSYDDYVGELGPTLYSLMLSDKIYKDLHKIKAEQVVDYGDIDLGTHKVKLGEVAVWFGKMTEKYPHLSIDKLMAEPEVVQQISNWGSNAPQMGLSHYTGR